MPVAVDFLVSAAIASTSRGGTANTCGYGAISSSIFASPRSWHLLAAGIAICTGILICGVR